MKPDNPLLKKKALDAVLEALNSPDGANDPRRDEAYSHPLAQKGTEPESLVHAAEEEDSKSPDTLPMGTKLSGFTSGKFGPFKCGNCQFFKASCGHPVVVADPDVEKTEDNRAVVDKNDCCNYFKSSACVSCETGDCLAHSSESEPPSNPEDATFFKESDEFEVTKSASGEVVVAKTKSYGMGTPIGGTPNAKTTPVPATNPTNAPLTQEEEEMEDEQEQKMGAVEIHETPKSLPPRDDMRRHLDTDVEKDVMKGIKDEPKTSHYWEDEGDEDVEEPKRIVPFVNLSCRLCNFETGKLNTLDDAEDEMDKHFINYHPNKRHVEKQEYSPNPNDKELLKSMGIKAKAKNAIQIEETFSPKCPNCKTGVGVKVEPEDHSDDALFECGGCGCFYTA